MKKVLCLLLTIVVLTACSSSNNESKETVVPTDETKETAEPTSTTDTSKQSDEYSIYGDNTNFVEIPVGATSKAFAFKVPSDSIVTGVRLNKDGNEEAIEDLSRYVTISEAISEGVLNENVLYGFEVTLDDKQVVYGVTYKASDISYDELIDGYIDKNEISDSNYQIYSFKEEYNEQVIIGISINAGDYIYTIALNSDPIEDYGSIANELYSLVSFN